MADTRIVYGARCVWWDSISLVRLDTQRSAHLPICPFCGSPLFEVDNEALWFEQIDTFERTKPWPGYREIMEWSRGKCFPTMETMIAAFEREHDEVEAITDEIVDLVEGWDDDIVDAEIVEPEDCCPNSVCTAVVANLNGIGCPTCPLRKR